MRRYMREASMRYLSKLAALIQRKKTRVVEHYTKTNKTTHMVKFKEYSKNSIY
jgi:hypothetical protein